MVLTVEDWDITPTFLVSTRAGFNHRPPLFRSNEVSANNNYSAPKVETKKERIKRIAKEKMFASWKSFNQKTEKIIEIKQICKPQHRIYPMGGRVR